MRGLDLMAAIHTRHPNQLVLLITAFGSIDLAVQSVRTEKNSAICSTLPSAGIGAILALMLCQTRLGRLLGKAGEW
jgi:ActR/RegA family two-component response regulator